MKELPPHKVLAPQILDEVRKDIFDPDALNVALELHSETGEEIIAVQKAQPQHWQLVVMALVLTLPFMMFTIVAFNTERCLQVLGAVSPLVLLLLKNYISGVNTLLVFTNQRVFVINSRGRISQLGTLKDCIFKHENGKTRVRTEEKEYVVELPEPQEHEIKCLTNNAKPKLS